MSTPKLLRGFFWTAEGLLLVGAVGAAAWISSPQEWQPLLLVALLLVLNLAGERFEFTIRGQHLSAGFIALVLAMTLLGPAPAVALGVGAMLITTVVRRTSIPYSLGNLSSHAIFPLAGGLMVHALHPMVGNIHDPKNLHLATNVTFGLIAFSVFMVTNTLNFAQVALDKRVVAGQSLSNQVRDLFIPLLPGQIATGALAAVLAVAYINLGLTVLLGSFLIIVIFQYLMVALLRSEDRADQLEARSIHLASLQLGVLTTLVETLALRDRSTARHAAAVARYARELAREVGCDEAEQDLIHTAGLLHDIGKFALPDHILRAEVLSDDDWAVIRRHPQDGATLVGRLDGYGPVADAILYHHEHVDGSGYPAGLIGNEIPQASRIIAICSTYDTLTARETYRSPMNPQDAMAEIRRVAGRQLDSELVNAFIAMLERDGPVTFAHGDDADFEAELAFGRRAKKIAQPPTG
ncbi:MAG TPA: HD domain-containing phosphohydrolase [Solirubrobacteraceae bacterium]|nr:HD domain-containing phosphohydrolase [Solirubrobacteraceae bacterium]